MAIERDRYNQRKGRYAGATPVRKWSIPKGTKIIRFTDENWKCFFIKGKETTWRMSKKKDGLYWRVKGSLYNPKDTGDRMDISYEKEKKFCDLNYEDAIRDGFDSLEQFKGELQRLRNNKIEPITPLYCHRVKVLKGTSRLMSEFEDKR